MTSSESSSVAAAPPTAETFEPCEVLAPKEQTAPVVFASPHSGRHYPAEFRAMTQLDPVTLRRSEDAFMDEVFGHAPQFGAPLLRAHFPRAFVDPNREPLELDPDMFSDRLPPEANTTSPRVAAGLGTVARVVSNGEEIYGGKMPFAEAKRRIDTFYWAYHRTLSRLIAETRERFGLCLVVDCHSMPSIGGPVDLDPGLRRVDFVLGDCHGTSCAPEYAHLARHTLESMGYIVRHNNPYAGGYTTLYYGRPSEGIHTLQVEINRGLYMDERAMERSLGMDRVVRSIDRLIEALVSIETPRRP